MGDDFFRQPEIVLDSVFNKLFTLRRLCCFLLTMTARRRVDFQPINNAVRSCFLPFRLPETKFKPIF
ncbi:MAG: hypothetical protein IJ881_06720 [Neisseriaceae bacterium]|nr:hypothetical protein [Neisseriaceae bacterium]